MKRPETISRLTAQPFDVLIIGGGITGCGIALDASARGLTVGLIEKHDFAFGTSSRSTKLIHGGLRYLKQLEFALVKEVGSERAIVHRLAPHLVVPEKMLLPLYESRGMGYGLTSIGLKIYDWLAGVKPEDRRRMLTRGQTVRAEPMLKPDDVKGGALYAEYRTDDARLTIEIAKLAEKQGALITNYVGAAEFLYSDGAVCGVRALDEFSGASLEIKAKAVVNAAGPWVDELRTINKSRAGKTLHLTKGVHIVVPYHRLPVRQAVYFDVPDGRMIFAIPRGRVAYIGTTDTDYRGDKNEVYATHEDAVYLLDAVNATFPAAHLTLADIESSWAGLRPLIHEEGKSASELSRKDEIFQSASGLVSIAGGKLTGYRKMSERVVDLLIDLHFSERTLERCKTDSMLLATGGFKTSKGVERYEEEIAAIVQSLGLMGEDGTNLVHLYGRQSHTILESVKKSRRSDPETDLILAELAFAVEEEMVVRADDFLVRRSCLLYFNLPRLLRVKDKVLEVMAETGKWDQAREEIERARIDRLISGALQFKA